ncbi:uncharacterized protein LOC134844868 [Symsagittifera roscoffensis]|uniref:uncharacterized protein LOC134844868 n=1 Tax=Symsagittifera roscoffensis TaxID=84072 RepID=UPI00307B75E9
MTETEWSAEKAVAIAIYNLEVVEPNVVSFKHGDLFQVQFSSEDWFYGKSLITGNKGLISRPHVFVMSQKEYPVEYECLTDSIRLEMFTSLFQWTEKLKQQLCFGTYLNSRQGYDKPLEAIKDALEDFTQYNRKIIFKGDQQRLYKIIDANNKYFGLAKKFRDSGGRVRDLDRVMSINICETGSRLIDQARQQRSMSSDSTNVNIIYQLIINTKGLLFRIRKHDVDVPLVYVFALLDNKSFEYISEPIAVRKYACKSHELSANESEDRELTYSFTSDWLRKQLRLCGINESRVRTDLLDNVTIACWAVATGDDIKNERGASNPKLKSLPDVQIPMYSGSNPAVISFPYDSALNSKTNTRISLNEVSVELAGRIEFKGSKTNRTASMGDELGRNQNNSHPINVSLLAKKKLTTLHAESRLSTQSQQEQVPHQEGEGLFYGVGETPLPSFSSTEGASFQMTRISVDIQPSFAMESKSILKGSPKFVFSSLSIAYANTLTARERQDLENPKIFVRPYTNCPTWAGDSFDSVVEVISNNSGNKRSLTSSDPDHLSLFMNRCHVDIELEDDKQANEWKKNLPYLMFELRRSRIATDYKDLLTKACLTDNVEHFKILGYCVMPLFDEVLPRNGEYQLKVLNLLQVNEILGTRPRENSKIVTWPFSSWAIDVFKRDDSDGGRSSQCNLTIDFSISSQILMNEGFVPQLLNLPDTLKILLMEKDFIQPHELDKSLNSIRDFLKQTESEREKNIDVCLRFLKKMLQSLFESILFIFNKMEDNQEILELLIELMIDLCWAVHREASQNQDFISGASLKALSIVNQDLVKERQNQSRHTIYVILETDQESNHYKIKLVL